MLSLYHNEGKGLFVDEAPRSEIGRDSLLTLGFGCFFFDYDLDGWPDILIANGHIDARYSARADQREIRHAAAPFSESGQRQFPGSDEEPGSGVLLRRGWDAARPTRISTMMGGWTMLMATNGGPAYLFRE